MYIYCKKYFKIKIRYTQVNKDTSCGFKIYLFFLSNKVASVLLNIIIIYYISEYITFVIDSSASVDTG